MTADSKRLAFGKDSSYDQWELDDATKKKEKDANEKAELSRNLNSMHPVNVVHTAVQNASRADDDADAPVTAENPAYKADGVDAVVVERLASPSPFWKVAGKPGKVQLSCGVEYE